MGLRAKSNARPRPFRTLQTQIQETAFLVQFVLELWFLVFDFGVCAFHRSAAVKHLIPLWSALSAVHCDSTAVENGTPVTACDRRGVKSRVFGPDSACLVIPVTPRWYRPVTARDRPFSTRTSRAPCPVTKRLDWPPCRVTATVTVVVKRKWGARRAGEIKDTVQLVWYNLYWAEACEHLISPRQGTPSGQIIGTGKAWPIMILLSLSGTNGDNTPGSNVMSTARRKVLIAFKFDFAVTVLPGATGSDAPGPGSSHSSSRSPRALQLEIGGPAALTVTGTVQVVGHRDQNQISG
eukprot:3688551-Rhodomonas_salina.1